jgi:leader peptidase (prepilin peptidase)/N-methyltransferase
MGANFRRLRLRPRRCRELVGFGRDILRAKGDARAFTHIPWIALCGLAFLLTEPAYLGWRLAPSLALLGGLALLSLFDARYFLIPDGPLLFLFVCGAVLLAADPQTALSRLLAGVFAFLCLWFVAWSYEKIRGEPGLGGADPALFAVGGLWLDFVGLPSCMLIAVCSGLISALLTFRGASLANARQPIPFGPHLALGIWLVWAFGPLEPI